MDIQASTTEIRIHPTRIFVGGLARGTTELELETFFSTYGNITDVRIVCDKRTGLNKGYGFVTYETPESRDNLLEKGLIDYFGRKLRLRKAVRRMGHGQFVTCTEDPTCSQNGYMQWILVPETTEYRAPSVYDIQVYYPTASPPSYQTWMPKSWQTFPQTCGYSYMPRKQGGTTYYYTM